MYSKGFNTGDGYMGYQSGFLEGTTPTYEAYMQLKKSIAASGNVSQKSAFRREK